MDLETSTAIESLRKELVSAETSLLRQISATEYTLRAEMRDLREELLRNAAVLTESVRDDIRIVADGLAAVSAKIDALKR